LNDPLRFHEREPYTADEARLVRRVNDAVIEETRRAFGRAIRPWMGPLTTMKLFRAIQAIATVSGRSQLRVFEIGPGSGYLGALLLAAGHRYWSTDIAQGFYLWQSRLMRALSPASFAEGALGQSYDADTNTAHMPWWDYATLYRGRAPAVDLVVCDHAFGEMHPYALRYVAQICERMLASSEVGFVVYTSVGEERFNSEEAIRLNFVRVGLDRVLKGELSLFARPERRLSAPYLSLAEQIPLYNPSGGAERLRGRDFVPIRADEAPLSYEFYGFLGYDVPRPTD
jgi:hypothetical protein